MKLSVFGLKYLAIAAVVYVALYLNFSEEPAAPSLAVSSIEG